jgi:hypothetical protein
MFDDVECSRTAFDKLKKAGIIERIQKKRKLISNLFGYLDIPYTPVGEVLFGWAEDQTRELGALTEKRRVAENIIQYRMAVENEFLTCEKWESQITKYPGFLGALVLKDDLLKFEDYGFPSRKSLEEAIVGYCFGDQNVRRSYGGISTWISGNCKNVICVNAHGDLSAFQKDISGNERTETTLFGEEVVFDSIKRNSTIGGIDAYQDWSGFLIATLQYARAIGQEIHPDIVNWRDTMKILKIHATNSAEAFGGSEDSFMWMMDWKFLKKGDIPGKNGISLAIDHQSERYYPYLDGENLVYSGINEVNLETKSVEQYKKCMTYTPKDIPHILHATYRFFARDRSRIPKIMDRFISEIHNS